jgi:hypothetical protein
VVLNHQHDGKELRTGVIICRDWFSHRIYEVTWMSLPPHDVTRLLVAWSEGDQSALNDLTSLVHEELHRLVHNHMRLEGPGHTLQTTALGQHLPASIQR